MTDHLEEAIREINILKRRVDKLDRLENYMSQNHGYVGGAWQNDPIRLGYSDVIRRTASSTTLAAGNSDLDDDGGAVPAGEIWVITNYIFQYSGTTTGVSVSFLIVDGSATAHRIAYQAGLTSGAYYSVTGYWVLKAGETLRVRVLSATLNDDLLVWWNGWKVDVDL